jgi:hypothetical protein
MKGYTLKDKVIKYSKVKVCRNKKKEDEWFLILKLLL